MDARDFIDVADNLAQGVSEAEWRSAVSRAYYGCFHLARRLLAECGFGVPRSEKAHAYIWLRLSNCGHVDISNAGANRQDLRSFRNQCDYDLDKVISYRDGINQVHQALMIADLLDAAFNETSVKELITNNIKLYEANTLKENTWKP